VYVRGRLERRARVSGRESAVAAARQQVELPGPTHRGPAFVDAELGVDALVCVRTAMHHPTSTTAMLGANATSRTPSDPPIRLFGACSMPTSESAFKATHSKLAPLPCPRSQGQRAFVQAKPG